MLKRVRSAQEDQRDGVAVSDGPQDQQIERGLAVLTGGAPADRARIVEAYHAWRGDSDAEYKIEANGWVLTPGHCVCTEVSKTDTEPFSGKVARLSGRLHEQFAESDRLQATIKANLDWLGCSRQGNAVRSIITVWLPRAPRSPARAR